MSFQGTTVKLDQNPNLHKLFLPHKFPTFKSHQQQSDLGVRCVWDNSGNVESDSGAHIIQSELLSNRFQIEVF